MKNGKYISFWCDSWLGDTPLCLEYPILYDLCSNKDASVADVASSDWIVQFTIILPPFLRDLWYNLATKLNQVQLEDNRDIVKWNLTNSGKFSVKCLYDYTTKSDTGPSYKYIWKAKIPLKIKIFIWLVAQKAILTKENMVKRKWQGDPTCYFCNSTESVDHLLFSCPIAKVVWGVVAMCFNQDNRPSSYEQYWDWIKQALPKGEPVYMLGLAAICWAIWKARNRACFDKKLIKHPCKILVLACIFMRYWAGLYPGEMQSVIMVEWKQ